MPESDLLTLTRPGSAAVVSRRAGALRLLRVGDTDLVEPTTRDVDPPGMAGAVLAPWPNRVAGARWNWGGAEHRLEATEPDLGNAIHGLVTGDDFAVRERGTDRVVLGTPIDHRTGYPFTLAVQVAYLLRADGIDVQVRVRNEGTATAPVALGHHPYLRIGDVPTSELTLTLDADHRWPLDEGHLPGARERLGRSISSIRVTDAPRHATFERSTLDGAVVHALCAPDGRQLTLIADPAHRFTQLWIPDDFDSDDGPRQAIAVEPMTAPPDALNSGVGLRHLAPQEEWTTGWSLRLTPAAGGSVAPD